MRNTGGGGWVVKLCGGHGVCVVAVIFVLALMIVLCVPVATSAAAPNSVDSTPHIGDAVTHPGVDVACDSVRGCVTAYLFSGVTLDALLTVLVFWLGDDRVTSVDLPAVLGAPLVVTVPDTPINGACRQVVADNNVYLWETRNACWGDKRLFCRQKVLCGGLVVDERNYQLVADRVWSIVDTPDKADTPPRIEFGVDCYNPSAVACYQKAWKRNDPLRSDGGVIRTPYRQLPLKTVLHELGHALTWHTSTSVGVDDGWSLRAVGVNAERLSHTFSDMFRCVLTALYETFWVRDSGRGCGTQTIWLP